MAKKSVQETVEANAMETLYLDEVTREGSEALVRKYLELNKQKSEIEAELRKIGSTIKEVMLDSEVDSINTVEGTVTLSSSLRPTVTSEYTYYSEEILEDISKRDAKEVSVTVVSKSRVDALVKLNRIPQEVADTHKVLTESLSLRCKYTKAGGARR